MALDTSTDVSIANEHNVKCTTAQYAYGGAAATPPTQCQP